MDARVAAGAAAALEQRVDVETPEQVVLTYTLAGIGSRAAAALIDAAIVFVAMLTISLALGWLLSTAPGARPGRAPSDDDVREAVSWVFVAYAVLSFAALWGYHSLFEAFADGQTIGKRRLGLRVVRDEGYPIGFGEAAARNLARAVDMQPGILYGIGVIAAGLSKSGKRLGDHLAGTIVVRERAVLRPVTPRRIDGSRAPGTTAALSEEEYALLERFSSRSGLLAADRRDALARELARRFERALAGEAYSDPVVGLERLYEREHALRAHGAISRSDTGARREQHALVAEGGARWAAYGTRLADAQRRGLRALHEDELSELAASYRAAAADLARLRTAARGRDADAVYYLSRLVAGGHNLLYGRPSVAWRRVIDYVAVTVPAELRRSSPYILAAALLFFVPAGSTYLTVRARPSLVSEIVHPVLIERADDAAARSRRGEGYVDDPGTFRRAMAAAIVTNNIQVSFLAFAFGLTAGVGTVLVLIGNGVSLGGGLGAFATRGVQHVLLDFVIAHGVLELSAICVAGGAGLLVARAIWLPGARSRRLALIEEGRRAVNLVAASAMMLVVAGIIEGQVSPRADWPVEWKYGVGAVTGLLFLLYALSGGRRSAARQPEAQIAPRPLSSR